MILGGTGGSGPVMSGDEILLFNFSSLKHSFRPVEAGLGGETRIEEPAES